MGKPNSHDDSSSDAMLLRSNPGGSSISAPYVDDDAPEINIDDLPPNYSDALESSEAAPMLAPSSTLNDTILPFDLNARVVIDPKDGAQYWVAKSVEDPDSLEKYIRQLATIPPRPYIKICGTHTETTKDSKGKVEKNTVTDFDVTVEMTPYLYSDAQYRRSWTRLRTVDNSEKVRRGTILRKRGPGSSQSIEVGGDAKPSLKEWCHRFAASSGGLKCFTFRRQMVGFDEEGVKNRLKELVRCTNYRGHLKVELVTKDAFIHCYNDAKLNRWRLTHWIRWLFYLTLFFIFSWPYLFVRTKIWEVAVAEWPFSRINESGYKEYVSLSEDQWYNMWGQAIARAVLEKRQAFLNQSDLRRAHEAEPAFNTGNNSVNGALGLFRAGIQAMNEVNRQLGWGGDC
ncbi:hypothetical protein HD806DRAFT_301891 [Xylariaceae sp. AK1471]|nr:hypothetical protein HD806DRAFT_301891 [Xylariaceae sp. AK1471]